MNDPMLARLGLQLEEERRHAENVAREEERQALEAANALVLAKVTRRAVGLMLVNLHHHGLLNEFLAHVKACTTEE
jgi:precorrin-2 methylase